MKTLSVSSTVKHTSVETLASRRHASASTWQYAGGERGKERSYHLITKLIRSEISCFGLSVLLCCLWLDYISGSQAWSWKTRVFQNQDWKTTGLQHLIHSALKMAQRMACRICIALCFLVPLKPNKLLPVSLQRSQEQILRLKHTHTQCNFHDCQSTLNSSKCSS